MYFSPTGMFFLKHRQVPTLSGSRSFEKAAVQREGEGRVADRQSVRSTAVLDLDMLMNVINEQTQYLPRHKPLVLVANVFSYGKQKLLNCEEDFNA